MDDAERKVVERYSRSLLAMARRQLPNRLRQRLDPEDIVQSVYRTFFRRLNEGEFSFEDSHDVWRLLAAMTYNKVYNVVKFHGRQRRDVNRESNTVGSDVADEQRGDSQVGPEDLAVLVECLEALMANLPDDYRPIVVMRLEGYSIEEIASQIDVSRRTVLRVLAKLPDTARRILNPE